MCEVITHTMTRKRQLYQRKDDVMQVKSTASPGAVYWQTHFLLSYADNYVEGY